MTRPHVRFAFVVGTRPEVIKMAPLISKMRDRAFVIHTGQHFDTLLKGAVLSAFDLSTPDVQLKVGGGSRSEQLSSAIHLVSDSLRSVRVDALIVHGDTNSTLAGAISADMLDIPVIHVESGLRSFDRRMPEERIRRAVDHISEVLLPPTLIARSNLELEGLGDRSSPVFGNTVVDSFRWLRSQFAELIRENPVGGQFVLATFHRPENVDSEASLRTIVDGLAAIEAKIVFPMHPRLNSRLREFNVRLPQNILATEPVDPLEFHQLLTHAWFVVTDSGGVIEEATMAKVPLLSVRGSTERPEAMENFAILLRPEELLPFIQSHSVEFFGSWRVRLSGVESPYGVGDTSSKIASYLDGLEF